MDCPVFDDFSGDFISELTFILTRKMFAIDDSIFDENNVGDKMYFITKGDVILWHSKSHTFIKEIVEGTTFGENSFFTQKPRICSARAKNFTEVLYIEHDDFERIIQHFPGDIEAQKHCLNCK